MVRRRVQEGRVPAFARRSPEALPTPTVPPSVRQSLEIQLLLALIEAVMGGGSEAEIAGRYESAVLAAEARKVDPSLIRLYPIPDHLRDLFERPAGEATRAILGWWEEDKTQPREAESRWYFARGLAGLEPREAEALSLLLQPVSEQDERGSYRLRLLQVWEVRDRMTAKRGGGSLSVEKVNELIRSARIKVRRLFCVSN